MIGKNIGAAAATSAAPVPAPMQFYAVFVSPAKQKRDICIAFPTSSLSSSAAA